MLIRGFFFNEALACRVLHLKSFSSPALLTGVSTGVCDCGLPHPSWEFWLESRNVAVRCASSYYIYVFVWMAVEVFGAECFAVPTHFG